MEKHKKEADDSELERISLRAHILVDIIDAVVPRKQQRVLLFNFTPKSDLMENTDAEFRFDDCRIFFFDHTRVSDSFPKTWSVLVYADEDTRKILEEAFNGRK